MTVAFDTLAVSHRLRSGGFSDAQANAMTEAISMGIHGGVATRDDIAEVRAEIAELRAEIAGVKKDLKWMKAIGATFGGVTLTLLGAILTLLARHLPLAF